MKLLPPLELKGKSWKKCYKNLCELASWRWAYPVGKLIIKGFRNCPTCVSGEEKEWRRYAPIFLLLTFIHLMFLFGWTASEAREPGRWCESGAIFQGTEQLEKSRKGSRMYEQTEWVAYPVLLVLPS